ncbi:unnamed protein product [Acanthoscelides obtectus]|uniref:Uncharacterized protein n=1 Tax=Acanthoscelides obtectus TaxID=200917 RepID=A0A9P0KKW3_ACAOB|nr:unnamed protein product [Acanthoscelides obtectus]CAK1664835.1 hypothetical protein AOBTE_LOCUS24497 [Acanthoscelides obtectus]
MIHSFSITAYERTKQFFNKQALIRQSTPLDASESTSSDDEDQIVDTTEGRWVVLASAIIYQARKKVHVELRKYLFTSSDRAI